VALAPNRMLVVLVTDAGGVSQRIAPLPILLDDEDVAVLRAQLASLITGRAVGEASDRMQLLIDAEQATATPRLHPALVVLAGVISEELAEFRQERLVMAGAATLARREQDFRGSIHPLLEAIEEQVTLLRLMSEMVTDEHGL